MLINQLAFPGLGTIMGGRRIGHAQAALMVTGFLLVLGFMVWFIYGAMGALTEPTWNLAAWRRQILDYAWVGFGGLALCGVAWGWALISSVGLLRGATPPIRTPPKLNR